MNSVLVKILTALEPVAGVQTTPSEHAIEHANRRTLRILFLLQEFPYPPCNGFRWKVLTLLQGISRRHECHVLSFADGLSESMVERFLQEYPTVKILGLFSPRKTTMLTRLRGLLSVGLPSAGAYSIPAFRAAVRRALAETQYDVVHIDMINLVQYTPPFARCGIVLSVNDAVSLGYENAANHSPSLVDRVHKKAAGRIIARYERRAYRRRVVHVVSLVDRAYLKELCPSAQVEVVQLAVDPTYLKDEWRQEQSERKTVTIPANFSLPSVSEAVLRFLKTSTALGKREHLNLVFKLVGPGADRAFLQRLGGLEGAEYLGWVPDYLGTLASSDLVVFPETSGSGTKTRVLQAMALAKPVLMTRVAADGVGATHGEHCFVCQTTEAFAEALVYLLNNDRIGMRLGSMARAFVQRHYSLDVVAQRWETLYRSVAAMANPGTCLIARSGRPGDEASPR